MKNDSRPSFQDVRVKHDISLFHLISDSDASLDADALIEFDATGRGEPSLVDEALAALSRLSEHVYDRRTVGHITLMLPGSSARSQRLHFLDLPQRPTLLEIYQCHHFSMYQVARATTLHPEAIYWIFMGKPAERIVLEKVLVAVSALTDFSYILDEIEAEVLLDDPGKEVS